MTKWDLKLDNAALEIISPITTIDFLDFSQIIFKKSPISQSKLIWVYFFFMCTNVVSVFSSLCDSHEEESRCWGKSFHINQGEAIKADESILSFTPGLQKRNHDFVFTGFIKSMKGSAHNSVVYVKAGSGCVFWKDHGFWSQIVMNSVYDMG